MAVPAVQIMVNADKMRVYFDHVPSTYKAYNLYYSTSSDMSGESKVNGNYPIPNSPDSVYSKHQIVYDFTRRGISLLESTTFYLRLKGILISTGAEDSGNPGATKYIPAVSDKIPLYSPVQLQGYDGNVWRNTVSDTAGKLDVV